MHVVICHDRLLDDCVCRTAVVLRHKECLVGAGVVFDLDLRGHGRSVGFAEGNQFCRARPDAETAGATVEGDVD